MHRSSQRSFSLLVAAAFVQQTGAFWRMNCGIIQLGRVDPIVNYDGVSGHVHIVAGPNNFNTTSNYDSLRRSLCTSCTVQEDKSAYWTPYMYYQKADGTFLSVKNGGIIIYYLGRGEGQITPFPPGFKMVSGSPGLRSYNNTTLTYGTPNNPPRPVADRASFKCVNYANPDLPETHGFPANISHCTQGLRAQIQFPSCWNGQDLYKADQSHVAYLSQIDNGICPPTHPVLLPHLFYEMYYNVDSVDTSDGGRFLLATGDTTGYGYHGDFLDGWNPDVQQRAVRNCLSSTGSGQIEDCADLTASNDAQSGSNCPLQPPLVDERISGTLSAIPGCNPPTAGPGRATQQLCPGKLVPQNTVTDGQSRQLPVTGNTSVTLSSGSKATYLGCYVDNTGGRALSDANYADSSSMTAETCGAFCQSKGYSIFGTEYASEYWCGKTISSTKSNVSDCNMACSGNLATYCGGPDRLSVWTIANTSSISTTSLSTVAPTSSPTPSPTAAQPTGPTLQAATYLGCYTDSVSSRALSGFYSNSNTQTLDTCAAAARTNGYKFFGLEYSGECFTGNTIASTSNLYSSDNFCRMPCSGNASQTCGGSDALSMWWNDRYVGAVNKGSVSVAGATYKYAGCWMDAAGNRRTLNGFSFSERQMTVEVCVAACQRRGYAYAGAEYAGECWCDAAIRNGATMVDDGNCNMRCKGDEGEWCGAGNRLSVYRRV